MRLFKPSSLLLFTLAVLAGCFVLGTALAQGTVIPEFLPGVPAEYQAAVLSGLGLVSGFVTYLLTAVYKRLKKTSGVTTVQVSAVLSVIVSLGFTLWQAYLTRGETPWYVALLVAVWAFVQSNASWIARVESGVAANRVNGGQATPAAETSTPPSGIGPIGARPLLGLPLNMGSLETLVDLVLTGAGIAATPALLIRLGARLAVVAPDLLDGDVHLSAENRNRVLGVVMDLKREGGLG